MNSLVFAIVGGVVLWGIAGWAIWQWGPGLRNRSVRCPVLKRRAKVLADQREAEFGSLMVVDAKSCSLAPGQALTCSKGCLSPR
jgi:hypothetical protein